MPADRAMNLLNSISVTGDRIDLSWERVPGCSTYAVSRAVAHGSMEPLAVTKETSFSDRELIPATQYRYAVSAMAANGSVIARMETACHTRPAGLFVTTEGARLTVHGDAFEITWDGDAGGEIAEIRQYDGSSWFRVNAEIAATVPGFVLTDEAGKEWALRRERGLRFRMEKETPQEVRFSASATAAGIRVGMRYIIFREGILFCELSMPESELSEGRTQGVDSEANKALLDKVSGRLALHLDSGILDQKFAWGYIPRHGGAAQVSKKQTDRVLDEKQMLPIFMADYGRRAEGGFTNHIEFFIEDTPPEGASTWFGEDGQGGFKLEWSFAGRNLRDVYFVPWDMGFFRTRWGLCLGAARKGRAGRALPSRRNNLIGARVCHVGIPQGVGPEMQERWPYNVPPADQIRAQYRGLPADEEVEAAHQQGANVMVLHQGWMRSGGSNCEPPADYIPRDPADLRRFVESCHLRNIRVGLYMRGVENHALFQPYFEQFLKRDFDGLYVDWSSPCCTGFQGCSELHFSAFNYFLFTRALRERVGEEGFLIAHSGAIPTMLAFAVFDAYLPGEFRTQKENLHNSPGEALHYGFASCIGTHPIPRFDLPQALALYAGLGFHPHYIRQCGQGKMDNPMESLWHMWGSVPIEGAVCYNGLTENLQVVRSSNRDFLCVLYKVNPGLLLLVAANLGERAGTALKVDMPALGLLGRYRVEELSAGKEGRVEQRECGMTPEGVIEAEAFDRYEYRGYRLERSGGE